MFTTLYRTAFAMHLYQRFLNQQEAKTIIKRKMNKVTILVTKKIKLSMETSNLYKKKQPF